MPPKQPRTQVPPISITDFSPGIMDEPSTSYPPGAATRANTFRCISSQSGALEPMFKLVTFYNGVDWNDGAPEGGGSYVVDGFFAAGPLIPTSVDVVPSDRPHELWLGVEYTTDTDRVHNLERLLVDEQPFTRETIKTVTTGDTTQALNGWGMTFGATRANQDDPNAPGIPSRWACSARLALVSEPVVSRLLRAIRSSQL